MLWQRRNKVQYESFDFKVLATEHFNIYFYSGERDAAEQAARMAERWYARLSTLLKHQLRKNTKHMNHEIDVIE